MMMDKQNKIVPATRDEVARLAGVSTATVSRVFNKTGHVIEAKKQSVLQAARKLNYQPDKNASALRRRGSGTIAFLEKHSPYATETAKYYHWFYADVLKAIKTVIDDSMYTLSLLSYRTYKDIDAIADRGLADSIIGFGIYDVKAVRRVAALSLPYVICHHRAPEGYNRVFTDDRAGAKLAAEKFLATGHTRPAHISAHSQTDGVCRDRRLGFQDGFPNNTVLEIDGELGIQGGYLSAQKLIDPIRKGHIDCLFVVNDLTAIGVVQAFQAAGISIPRDISIIGYDHLPFIDTLPFRLTTIDAVMGEAYRLGAKRLLASMQSGAPIEETVRPRLIEGASVAERKN